MIKIAINTTINYSEKTLPLLIPGIIDSGIKSEDIYVFEAGHEHRSFNNVNGINYFKANQNSFDYTSFIEILDIEIYSKYWFYLHDTCVVGNKFNKYINNIPSADFQYVSACKDLFGNIGLYSYDYLKSKSEFIFNFKNQDYSEDSLLELKVRCVKAEGEILRPSSYVYRQDDSVDINSFFRDWYGTGERYTMYLKEVDVFKNQKNYIMEKDKKYSIKL